MPYLTPGTLQLPHSMTQICHPQKPYPVFKPGMPGSAEIAQLLSPKLRQHSKHPFPDRDKGRSSFVSIQTVAGVDILSKIVIGLEGERRGNFPLVLESEEEPEGQQPIHIKEDSSVGPLHMW